MTESCTAYTRNDLFIGGKWVSPHGTGVLEVISPHTEQLVGSVPDGSNADIDRAVLAARDALNGPWGKTPPQARATIMERLCQVYADHADEMAATMTAEMGCIISVARSGHVGAALTTLEYYTKLVAATQFEEEREGAYGTSVVQRLPVGVVAAIIPWNGPPPLAMVKVAAALAAGCTVVLKPSPEAPFTSYLLAEIALEAGLPDGVLNVVPAGREVSEYLVTHPDVDAVSFTGSSLAGRRIASLCGELLRPVTLELGGKSAAIILADADLESTVAALRNASFRNSGQACVANSRILVPEHRFDEFVEAISVMASSFRIGDPADPLTEFGPLVSARQRDRVEGYIRKGLEEGARITAGGGRPASMPTGWYVEPTVFVDVDNSMTIAREEIFGPVVVVMPYRDEAEAIAIANDSEYGLHGTVWTQDADHGLEVARQVRAGTLAVNGFGCEVVGVFGGMKGSGIGREMGPEGLDEFLEPQCILMPLANTDEPAAH
jgi:aldehyde dehydrogenase (NAD+)